MANPVTLGVVQSLARQGGNITGISSGAGLETLGKRLEILKELLPTLSSIGFLVSRTVWDGPSGRVARESAARLGISLLGPPLEGIHDEAEYRRVFGVMSQERVDALFVYQSPENAEHRRLIIALAETSRLPAIYGASYYMEAGGLLAYGYDIADLMKRAAGYVDQILKGAKPADMPIYQATKFQLIINLKAAKALGITVPPSLLARADEVIE
jgi:putative tryptophan/tyrosine transport system substrate-binding protein